MINKFKSRYFAGLVERNPVVSPKSLRIMVLKSSGLTSAVPGHGNPLAAALLDEDAGSERGGGRRG